MEWNFPVVVLVDVNQRNVQLNFLCSKFLSHQSKWICGCHLIANLHRCHFILVFKIDFNFCVSPHHLLIALAYSVYSARKAKENRSFRRCWKIYGKSRIFGPSRSDFPLYLPIETTKEKTYAESSFQINVEPCLNALKFRRT